MAIGYEEVEMSVEDEGCSTPTREEYRIQVGPVPPPPPRKKPVVLLGKKRVVRPENGYFQAPDLEMLFAVNPIRRQACA